jgi:hypothetical protein
MWLGGGNLVRVMMQEIKSNPEINPALARVPFAKPSEPLIVLLSIIGCKNAPKDDPDATIVMARALRSRKY